MYRQLVPVYIIGLHAVQLKKYCMRKSEEHQNTTINKKTNLVHNCFYSQQNSLSYDKNVYL